ncbi:SAM-dependent methyltransferase [Candidatus Parcubacteria bacterium]|nr:MAG: SAM-dependent methyltransferase [Candidatus Parcubacteria bacterium]
MRVNPSSFRDPSGTVFTRNGQIYRSIFKSGVDDFNAAKAADIYIRLVKKDLLLPFEEIDRPDFAAEDTVYCLSHPCLPMVSYPWEWPFSMLKDAALLHLDVMEDLIPKGFWLRDASAFNIQYWKNKLCLIDTLSIGRMPPEEPWIAYGQFCSHFIAPLAMAAHSDIRTLGLWRNYIDGFPLDLAANLLPLRRKYLSRLFMHLTLHARFQNTVDRKEKISNQKRQYQTKVSEKGRIGLIRSLRKTIQGISYHPASRIWMDYDAIRTYGSEDISQKREFVDRVIQHLRPEKVWDMGANTGEFSLIAAGRGAFVVSIDGDPCCTEFLYRKITETGENNILPLTMDFTNPSPSLGWNASERMSIRERGPANLLLALALIHHLVFSCCVPLSLIAQWFADLAEHLLVEFVPPEDPMVRRLSSNRKNEHHTYSIDKFQKSFGNFFHFIEQKILPNGRMLFLCRRKRN